ncbi:hypothetical protein KEM52_003847, partial [Ascosphaera acerosa]
MVRLKNRYLLVNILYPEEQQEQGQGQGQAQAQAQRTDLHSLDPILAIHRPSPANLTPTLLSKIIRACVAELFGDWGVGRLGGASASRVAVKYLSPATSTAIIRCPRSAYRLVWAALTLISALPTRKEPDSALASLLTAPTTTAPPPGRAPCVFQVVRVSGTIKQAEEEAIRRARRDVARLMNA